ncbi:unnamed protein product [Peronospora farinosa]|uniref:Uncharacterized protein n=1 Tax=Peronospora farinosa TaxID=134698 RepID=A0ABN8BWL6_9STRA|nr:unnamed protein product [Peronospora farinosa]
MPGMGPDYENDAKEMPRWRVSDDMRFAEMKRKAGAMINDRVPDVTKLFSRELKMNLSNLDVEARITGFMDFNSIVEEYGLVGMLDRETAVEEEGRQRMKL